MDTLLYDTSIPYISSLQSTLADQAPFMQLMSVVFDPKYAFLIYSPLAYLLDQKVGRKLIMTTVLAEWLNMILKWLFHGERPYWYVHSSGHFEGDNKTPIRQFPITCELGPGHPSGHSMVTAAVWYIIIDSIVNAHNQGASTPTTAPTSDKQGASLKIKAALWTLYGLLLMTVGVSRVFLACHFPHQCLAGAALGLLVAKLVSSRQEPTGSQFMLASLVMLTTAFGTFGLLQTLGLDPAWTIKLATKHCEKREYIHVDTAPFFSIMRYSGFALGAGLALCLANLMNRSLSPVEAARLLLGGSCATRQANQTAPNEAAGIMVEEKPSSHNISWLSAKLLMALLMARLVDNLGLFVSHSNIIFFYSSAFLAYTGFSFAFINL